MSLAKQFFQHEADDNRIKINELAESSGLSLSKTFATFMMPSQKTFRFRLEASRYKPQYPTFIFGGSNSGKSHLLKAIGYEELEINSEKSVLYLDSKSLSLFTLAKARSVDLLLIDDIHKSGNALSALIRERAFRKKRTVITLKNEEQIGNLELGICPERRNHLELKTPAFILEKQMLGDCNNRLISALSESLFCRDHHVHRGHHENRDRHRSMWCN